MNSKLRAATNLILAVSILAVLMHTVGAQAPPDIEQHDTVCGPRCAVAVLAHFGQEVPLIELVREMQFPDIDNGCSLADIQEALSRRGIHSCAIRLATSDSVYWPEPVVIHSHISGNNVGHFAFAPSGYGGAEPLTNWVRGASGTILLTSRAPIAPSRALAAVSRGPAEWPWVIASLGTVSLGGVYLRRSLQTRRS